MLIRQIVLVVVTAFVIGATCAFLWVQIGLPTGATESPWNPSIILFPSIYAIWLPLVYLFFSGMWLYLLQQHPHNEVQVFLRVDGYSYAAVLGFFLMQITWRELGDPDVWLRVAICGILLFKSVLLLRAFYHTPQLIHPVMLVIIGVGIHLLLIPFRYESVASSITLFTQTPEFSKIVSIVLKSLGLNLMTLEMWRLGKTMTTSPRSAFFSWVIVTFTFPVLGFPRTSYILAGLLIIFILRLVFSRLDTRELMIGLLNATNLMILLKLLIIVFLLVAAGMVYWSNVKPGFVFRAEKAVQAATQILADGQFGLFSFAPIYVLAWCGVMYVLFFKVWDGMLLILSGGLLYIGYHLAMYGILDRVLEEQASVPFLPIFGVFIAIAHSRFGKMVIFRYGVRLFIILTIAMTFLLLLFYPELPSVPDRIAEIQRILLKSLGKDITYILPSFVFRPFPLVFFIWLTAGGIIALMFCNARTRSGAKWAKHLKKSLEHHMQLQEFTFAPGVVLAIFLLGIAIIAGAPVRHPVAVEQVLRLSRSAVEQTIPLQTPLRGRELLVVSNVTGSALIPQRTPVANITVFEQQDRFQPLTMKIGIDTAEERLEERRLKPQMAHERATLYRSWNMQTEDGTLFAAHDYYTRFSFSHPIEAQKITFKFIDPAPGDRLSEVTLQIKEIVFIE